MFDNTSIEVPFEFRHHCWFCAEPAGHSFTFPHQYHLIFDCPHEKITLPSCAECRQAAYKAKVGNIWQVAKYVKAHLFTTYRKDLAIGLNWTQDELENAGFEDGNFAGFKKSAWFVYQVAKQRVNFQGWSIVLNGVEIVDDNSQVAFFFDGVNYPNIEQAIQHYSVNFDLDRNFLRKVLAIFGPKNFAKAVRFCRLYIGATPNEKAQALGELAD